MPRLGHRKSRNGCRQCKARHVKCDESRPCSNCSRHGVLCSLIDPNSGPIVPTQVKREPSTASMSRVKKIDPEPVRKNSESSLAPIDYVLNPSPSGNGGASDSNSPETDPYPYLSKFINRNDVIQPNYWVRDLELMHHWVTVAHETISPREDIRFMWRIHAPKQAIKQQYLMHEILAYSALHIAYSQPELMRPYYNLGIHHQDLAIRSMRKVLPHMSPDNAGALVTTSSLLTLTVYASRGIDATVTPKPVVEVIDDLLDIFHLTQGISSILRQAAGTVAQGPFAALIMRSSSTPEVPPVIGHMNDQLSQLYMFLESQEMTPEERANLNTALDGLKDMLAFSLVRTDDSKEIRLLYACVLRFSLGFFEMLRQRHNAALALMSVYAVGLKATEHLFWFMRGWAERLVRAIGQAIDPSWQSVIQWSWDYIIQDQPQTTPPSEFHHGPQADDLQERMQEQRLVD